MISAIVDILSGKVLKWNRAAGEAAPAAHGIIDHPAKSHKMICGTNPCDHSGEIEANHLRHKRCKKTAGWHV
jgi:hypothetical protein